MSLTVRITSVTHRSLKGLSRATGKSMQDLIALAIDEFRRKWILEASGDAFRKLARNCKERKSLQSEQKLWECTLADGLDTL